MAASLRSPEMNKKMEDHRKAHFSDGSCPLCIKPALKAFVYWKIIPNAFPYDLIAKEHRMVVPIRHVMEHEITEEEWAELRTIEDQEIHPAYDYIIEATPKNRSIPAHFHRHLIVAK
jgi:hypothetical protein